MVGDTAMPEGVEQSIRTTEIDLEEVRGRLVDWLTGHLGTDSPPQVTNLRRPEHSGMSSVSLLFDLAWQESGERREQPMVARLAPEATAYPVFPGYDLQAQYDAMRVAGGRSGVPVPHVRWVETSAAPLGTPSW